MAGSEMDASSSIAEEKGEKKQGEEPWLGLELRT